MNMIISRAEANQACADVDQMQDMGLVTSAQALLTQEEIISRTVPIEVTA